MEEVVASVGGIRFEMEIAIEEQRGSQPLPFPGMDKSGAAICDFFVRGSCVKGASCPFRHVRGEKSVVCKHWLRGLCKKGDQCEFLHEYDMTKMPECYFYSKFGACSNKECPFLHIDPESKIKDCAWYDRGFCKHGPHCKNRHVRRTMCMNYMVGFCPEGPKCKYKHPKFDLPISDTATKKTSIVCHHCGESGHKAISCPSNPNAQPEAQNFTSPSHGPGYTFRPREERGPAGQYRPLESVTCFKCGEKGHYANKCPKGHLAFLSTSLHPGQQHGSPGHPPPRPLGPPPTRSLGPPPQVPS
ncbi:cleavage and polyadenylation specificity factor subunit 4-like [Branchiostoma floridae x Branchiostoma belcheri]